MSKSFLKPGAVIAAPPLGRRRIFLQADEEGWYIFITERLGLGNGKWYWYDEIDLKTNRSQTDIHDR